MGLLEVTGTLDPKQFWPSGSADGDTAHVRVVRVTFNGKATHAFHGAHVRGRIQKGLTLGGSGRSSTPSFPSGKPTAARSAKK